MAKKFVINKFYLYIRTNKTKVGADADGRAEFRKSGQICISVCILSSA